MKLIPSASQTVGPFFSIGLAPLYQDAAQISSASAITISGTISDGEGKPIPDAVLEFWGPGEFARVPTNDDGKFSAVLGPPRSEDGPGAKITPKHYEVLIFMRGLLKPVCTRVYLAAEEQMKNDPVPKTIPPERIGTLVAKPEESANEYGWNILMQGENETVFFEY